MTARRKAKVVRPLFDETPPTPDRLRAMIAACGTGKLNAPMRKEIVNALKKLEAKNFNEALKATGAPVALQTFRAAALARELVNTYRVKPARSAILAAIETMKAHFSADRITIAAVERAYRKIRKSADCSMVTGSGDKYQLATISNGVIDYALARLPRSAKALRTNRIPAPPFAIAVAHLFNLKKTGNK